MTQYKTADDLGITEEQHTALVKTIDVLRAEQVSFDMGITCSVNSEEGDDTDEPSRSCNTNCCIGGTMSLLMQNNMQIPEWITPAMGDLATEFVHDQRYHTRFTQLFYGDTTADDPKDGIAAIERFLSGNIENPWLE